jgi:hypothetical protein
MHLITLDDTLLKKRGLNTFHKRKINITVSTNQLHFSKDLPNTRVSETSQENVFVIW